MIRAAAKRAAVFQDMGIAVGRGWTASVPEDDRGRTFLLRYAGRYVKVHPEDGGKLEKLGLELVDGRVVEKKAPVVEKKAPAPPTTPAPDAPAPAPAPDAFDTSDVAETEPERPSGRRGTGRR